MGVARKRHRPVAVHRHAVPAPGRFVEPPHLGAGSGRERDHSLGPVDDHLGARAERNTLHPRITLRVKVGAPALETLAVEPRYPHSRWVGPTDEHAPVAPRRDLEETAEHPALWIDAPPSFDPVTLAPSDDVRLVCVPLGVHMALVGHHASTPERLHLHHTLAGRRPPHLSAVCAAVLDDRGRPVDESVASRIEGQREPESWTEIPGLPDGASVERVELTQERTPDDVAVFLLPIAAARHEDVTPRID